MALTIWREIDEHEIADAIRNGDLKLELILQNCLTSNQSLERLIKNIEALGGTREAGERTMKFASAMIQR